MRLFLLVFGILFVVKLPHRVNGLSCGPCGPCEKPVCCPSGRRRGSRLPPKRWIDLVSGPCGCCNDRCPKQWGEQCGGMWGTMGQCDKGLRCKPVKCRGKPCQRDRPGKCILDKSSKAIQDGDTVDRVAVCDPKNRRDACKCDLKTTKSNDEWCFLKDVKDPEKPTKGCFDDVRWSETYGRFWSHQAIKKMEKPRG